MILPLQGTGVSQAEKNEGEGIDVRRVRLWNARNGIAVLSDFYSADRVLEKWALNGTRSAVRFEVTFVDAYVLAGYHEFFEKGKRTCTFSTHLRRIITRMMEADDISHFPLARDVSSYVVTAY